MTPRDAFFNVIYELSKEDNDIVIVSADFGCESLDRYKKDFPHRFINAGIAEQNAILLATGLALEGKKPFVYGIASFISLRCLEQIRVNISYMGLPINIVGVGSDDSYREAGFTHCVSEDVPIIESLGNILVYDVRTSKMAKEVADIVYKSNKPNYIRMTRTDEGITCTELE